MFSHDECCYEHRWRFGRELTQNGWAFENANKVNRAQVATIGTFSRPKWSKFVTFQLWKWQIMRRTSPTIALIWQPFSEANKSNSNDIRTSNWSVQSIEINFAYFNVNQSSIELMGIENVFRLNVSIRMEYCLENFIDRTLFNNKNKIFVDVCWREAHSHWPRRLCACKLRFIDCMAQVQVKLKAIFFHSVHCFSFFDCETTTNICTNI